MFRPAGASDRDQIRCCARSLTAVLALATLGGCASEAPPSGPEATGAGGSGPTTAAAVGSSSSSPTQGSTTADTTMAASTSATATSTAQASATTIGSGGVGGGSASSVATTGAAASASVGGNAGVVSSSATGVAGANTATTGGGTGGEPAFVEPTLLSQTGLFSDIPTETLADGVMEFTPNYALWSDGATKRRWVYLPAGAKIDSYASVDYWTYPVGTKLWKEFTRDDVRVETRLIQKIADEEWFMVAFQWNDEGTDAIAVPGGQMNARQTEHDIPDQEACQGCHGNMKDHVLGFSALQLSHDGPGVTLDQLIAEQRFNAPPSVPFATPGTAIEQAALGYMHANCGHCHNDSGGSEAFSEVDMVLWLRADGLQEPASTASYTTTIDQNTQAATGLAGIRVVPGDFENSILYQRFVSSDPEVHMPPLGTEIVDPAGLQILQDWIMALE